ncbi:MAG: DUF1501 domain-containing protein [Phycisphaerales bacterium]|nr:DUF1501 domain-containing protein [Phycisphaerales bacterium]NNM27330.1 DUF1501 domain-containing protein [Phycisphaerales bacterium]
MHDTTGQSDNTFTRRRFLHQGLTFASLAATTPLFVERSARAMTLPLGSLIASQPGVPEDHVLVVVQLGGGNDGLNTVVPYGDPAYHRARPALAIRSPRDGAAQRNGALTIDDNSGIGLHPNLTGFKSLMDDGVACVVQGVGYPNPNRSHFTSMDIWHTANERAQGHGWIGRYFDNTCGGTPVPEGSIAIGREAPLAMQGSIQKPVAFESAELFRWLGEDLNPDLGRTYQKINRGGELPDVEPESQLGFLMRTALDAQVSSDRIRNAMEKTPLVRYPRNRLADQLRTVAAMIRDGMRTRVYYVSLGGFDTHANQAGSHGNLMRQLGSSLQTFHSDLKAQGNSGRVLTMVFSEFGRRVAQNASGGTDHGTAAPMYLVGDMVRPGLLGNHPSLTNLDQGDLRFNVDFRSIYAAVIEDWMGADANAVLGKRYPKAKVIA